MNKAFPEIDYFLSNNLTHFKPWEFISGERLAVKSVGLKQRFPNIKLFPFAVKSDSDDVACYDYETPNKVFIIHDYSSVGWEQREVFDNFWDWFKRAINDMVEFAKEDLKYKQNIM